jgi:hypothetical protein
MAIKAMTPKSQAAPAKEEGAADPARIPRGMTNNEPVR